MANTVELLRALASITGGSSDYFVMGSLAILPHLPGWREPGEDLDFSVSEALFGRARSAIASLGRLRFLRLPEVAVAHASVFAWVLPFRTSFAHLDTPDGLLDLSVYRRAGDQLLYRLGSGLDLSVPALVAEESRIISWRGVRFRAAPMEYVFVPKIAGYSLLRGRRIPAAFRKHAADLEHMAPLVDWELVEHIVRAMRVLWRGIALPAALQRAVNPIARIDVEEAKRRLMG
jgi:hypothetical protein